MKAKVALILAAVFAAAGLAFAAEPAKDEKPDTRLEQKVTYKAKGQLLHTVLEELTEKTKVEMRCGLNEKDWQVRDRKVTIVVKDMPLGDIQKELSKLLHFTWAKGLKEGVPTYRIFQDLKSSKEEASLRNKVAQEKQAKAVAARESALASIENLENLSPQDLEQLKKDSPFLYIMAKEPFGQGLTQILQASPDLRNATLQGTEFSMPVSGMGPGGVAAAQKFVGGLGYLMNKFSSGQGDKLIKGVMNNIGNAKMSYKTLEGMGMGEQAAMSGMFGMMEISVPGEEKVSVPLFDPNSPMANIMGKVLLKLDEGATLEEAGKTVQDDAKKAFETMQKAEEQELVSPTDADLDTKPLKLELTSPNMLPDILAAIADKTEMNIISDNFLHTPDIINTNESKLTAMLKEVSKTYGKNITRKGNLLVVQDAKWFTKRSWEIADEWLKYWAKQYKDGKLALDDFANMACLTDDQINHTLKNDDTLGVIAWQITMGKDVLRFYAALSAAQRKSILSKTGLDASTLANSQKPYLDYLLTRTDFDSLGDAAPLKLYMKTQEGREPVLTAESTVVNPEDGKEKKWTHDWRLRLMLPDSKPKASPANPAKPKTAN